MSRSFIRAGAAIPLLALAISVAAQSVPAAALPRSLYDMTATEVERAKEAARADSRVSGILGFGPALAGVTSVELDKAESVPFLSGQTGRQPARYVSVLLFNERTNAAVRARVELGTMRVLDVERAPLHEVPLFDEEAAQAFALARADSRLREAIGASFGNFQLRLSGANNAVPYAAEVLPITTASVRDLCYTGRCVEMIFRTPTGYLPVRAQVNVATRTVTVIRRGATRHGGMHQ